jgi:transcription termination factor Rho
MSAASFQDRTLAELHELAAERGVPGYRMLSRPELLDALRLRDQEDEGTEAEEAEGTEAEEAEPAEERDEPEGRSSERGDRKDAATEPVQGVLDQMPQGFGFLRIAGLEQGEGDVYISASQIRRCELRPGDLVTGPAREPRRGERHRALIRVDSVNGEDADVPGERTEFEDLTPVPPSRRVPLGDDEAIVVRAIDLLGPLALGQRVLIRSQPQSGRTTLLRALAAALSREADLRLMVLLADERPEEITEWRRALPEGEIAAAAADQEPIEHARAAELAVGHVKRLAEGGEDVVLLIDSLSRLGLGYRDPLKVKRLFGAGRELSEEGSGSLAVVATVLEDGDPDVLEAVETTENLTLALDPELASAGIDPPVLLAESRTSGEDALREPAELEAVRALRAELEALDPTDAARALGERIASSKSNAELLGL